MATRPIVPRATGEGSIGTFAKHWGNIYADNGNIAGRNIATDGVTLDNNSSAITALQGQVTTLEHAYAGAKAAATVADMTDHNQIYVYVGSETGYINGNWYYWNGTAWTSGGVYNATALETDKTLMVSGAAADSATVGRNLNAIFDVMDREISCSSFSRNFINGSFDIVGTTIRYSAYNKEHRITNVNNPIYLKEGTKIKSNDTNSGLIRCAYSADGTTWSSTNIISWAASITLPASQYYVFIITTNNIINDAQKYITDYISITDGTGRLEDALTITKYVGDNIQLYNMMSYFEEGSFDYNSETQKVTYSSYLSNLRCTNVNNPLQLESGIKITSNGKLQFKYAYSTDDGETWVHEPAMVKEAELPVDALYVFVFSPFISTIPVSSVEYMHQNVVVLGAKGLIDRKVDTAYENSMFAVSKLDEMPSYYDSYIATKSNSIINQANIANGDSFIFVTDVHMPNNKLNSKYLIKYIIDNTPITKVVFGGDIIRAFGNMADIDTDSEEWLRYSAYWDKPTYCIQGNHDFLIGNSDYSDGYTKISPYAYNILDKRIENDSLVTIQAGKRYYYIDNDVQKMRYVIVNEFDYEPSNPEIIDTQVRISPEQFEWLGNALNKPGYTVIVFTHAPTDPNAPTYGGGSAYGVLLQGVLEALANKTSLYNADFGVNVDFTNSTTTLAAHISGHAHVDWSKTTNNVLSIITTCDALYQDDGHGGVADTITEQAFDVFTVDTNNRTIKAIRVGRGNNRSWTY